jgi:hypothetical protein
LAEEAAAAADAPADPPAADPMEDDWGSFATAGKKKKGKKGKVAEPEPLPELEPEPPAPEPEPEPEPAAAAPDAAADDMWGFATTTKKKKGKKGKVSQLSLTCSLYAFKVLEGCLTATWCDYPGRAYSKRARWWLALALRATLHTASNPNVQLHARGAHATPLEFPMGARRDISVKLPLSADYYHRMNRNPLPWLKSTSTT